MIHASLRVPICKLKQFQEILGTCHGTFDCNPIMFMDIARVSISFKKESDGNTFIK